MKTCKTCAHWCMECNCLYHYCNRDALYDPNDRGRGPSEAYIAAVGTVLLTGPDFGCVLWQPNEIAAKREALKDKIMDLHSRAIKSTPAEADLLFEEARKLHKQLWSKV